MRVAVLLVALSVLPIPAFAQANQSFIQGFGGLRMGSGAKASLLNAGTIGALLKQYPVISSIVSLVLAKPLRATFAAGAKPALKWGGLAFAAWEAYRVWQQIKGESRASARSGDEG